MDWSTALFSVATLVVGYLLAYFFGERTAERNWLREREMREAEWARADHRRWDKDRFRAYTRVWDEVLQLSRSVRDVRPYWEREEKPPNDLMQHLDDRREAAMTSVIHASLIAGPPVSQTLRPLLQTLRSMVMQLAELPSEDAQSAGIRWSAELWETMDSFTVAVAEEFGITADRIRVFQ